MERWVGRVAVVTGASAGIGAAIAYQLQDAGLTVVALARRVDKIPAAVEAARRNAEGRGVRIAGKAPTPGPLHSVKCDVAKEEDILSAFKWIKEKVGRVDVLVNNAGLGCESTSSELITSEWKQILDVNVLGLSICTREAIQIMKEKSIDDGHIFHIGSICGHMQPLAFPSPIYYASKHAVRVLTEGLRKELVAAKSKIRVTSISPGNVKTDILDKFTKITPEVRYNDPYLNSEDIADVVLHALSTPAHVQIHEVIIMPVGETM